LLSEIKNLGIEFPLRHIDNSGAIINYPDFKLNMVRPGIMTYGISPSPDDESGNKLTQVMSFKTSIVLLKDFLKVMALATAAHTLPKNKPESRLFLLVTETVTALFFPIRERL